jgi:cyclase
VARPALIAEAAGHFGSQCIVLAIDARRRVRRGALWFEVVTHGGRVPTGWDAVAWAEEATGLGAGEILLTSIDRDGTTGGYDLELTRAVASAVSVPVIASGGAGAPGHLVDVLTSGGADAALAASIFHFGTFPIPAVKAALAAAGVVVRRDRREDMP